MISCFFVNSVRWHRAIVTKTRRLNDRAVRGVCDIRPECKKMQPNFYRSEKEHLTGKVDGFSELATLFERLDKSGNVSFNRHANF